MAASHTKTRKERRDRRKAKASEWRREGTKNPKKVGHHASDGRSCGTSTNQGWKWIKGYVTIIKPQPALAEPLFSAAEITPQAEEILARIQGELNG